MVRRSDEPGAWYAMLPLEVVYAFDPVPPEPQHEEPATPMSRSGDGDSDGSGMDVESASNGMGDGGGVSVTPAYADWTLPTKDAHHIIGGQASDRHVSWVVLVMQGLDTSCRCLSRPCLLTLCCVRAKIQFTYDSVEWFAGECMD